MTLLPIPGAPGYRIDCENQVAYQFKGFLKKINARTKYKTVSLYIGGQTFVTTIYRMMWCAQHGADITRLPKGVNISMRNNVVTAISKSEVQNKRRMTRQANKERWQRSADLISKYYNGDVQPLLDELQSVEQSAKRWFMSTYGLSEDRAEICAAYGVNRYLDMLKEGFPSTYIMNSVIHYGRSENNRIRKESALVDDMQAIVIG